MNRNYLILYLVFIISGCNCSTEKKGIEENAIISKIYHKKNPTETDTLWVSQNDTAIFRQEEGITRNPGSNAKLIVRYELKKPLDGAYYFIYNNKKQLVTEGKYTAKYTYEDIIYKEGGFYNIKSYYYKNNGDLEAIHYQEDGRNIKIEHFDSNKRLTRIRYIDKKSENTTKVEIFTMGKLKETMIYTSFDNYYTVEADR